MKQRILTGDRPTGRLHLGHYVGSLETRVKLQHQYETFIMIADVQAMTTHFDNPGALREHIGEVMLDYLAVGIDPGVSTILLQSMIPEIAELTIFFSMFVTVSSLRHNPTTKQEIEEKGLKDLYYGFLGYPVSQAADITIFKAHWVPVGADQLPHIEQARRIARRFNDLYRPVLVEPQALLSPVTKLAGLDGRAKMSKSLDNCIYLSDPPETVTSKIKTAVTDPARIRRHDPGHPDICTVFGYHQAFNREEIEEISENCRTAGIGCSDCKRRLADKINALLDPIRERRDHYASRGREVREILAAGTGRARSVAVATMAEVREAMSLVSF
ncbi:MAG: tryptophan--tRNA ligase [Negativicutes bacterium]|nr:tryptophan--tRNA ligase [Negativicutes bacterium]